MNYLQEFPLALFTLLTQMAVGIVLTGRCMSALSGEGGSRTMLRKQSLPALIFLAVGAVVSLAHTGTPLYGPYTILGIGSSWLSREIASLGLVGASMLWLAWLSLKTEVSSRERPAAALVIAFGLLMIFTVSQVYSRPTMPGWNNHGIFPLFLGSAFMLGAAWNMMSLSLLKPGDHSGVNAGIIWAFVGYAAMAIGIPLAMASLGSDANSGTFVIPQSCLPSSHALHAAVSALGLLVLVTAGLRSAMGKGLSPLLGVSGFLILAVGEIFGRMVFYLSYSRLGM